MQYDIFNGDADGIFSLHQLRLASPSPDSQLISGVKRDINLLSQVETVENASITVLDISLDYNRSSLFKLLSAGNSVLYIDHHFAGDIPQSENLETHIDPAPHLCTALIVNTILKNRFIKWAICGAYGDNLHESAKKVAASTNLSDQDLQKLREIGELFNYNGYGATISDLHFPPQELYRSIGEYEDPLVFFEESKTLPTLREGFKSDLEQADANLPLVSTDKNRVYKLPQASWSRRITGTFSNLKAREKPETAHAIIVENNDGTYQISVRAPLENRHNADTLCRLFPTGGGRAAAAGINHLPADSLDEFINEFQKMYS
jgi:hypothetical protein